MRERWLSCPRVVGQKLGNSCCFQCDHKLHGVEFRGIGRQEFQPESATLLAHEVPYQATAIA